MTKNMSIERKLKRICETLADSVRDAVQSIDLSDITSAAESALESAAEEAADAVSNTLDANDLGVSDEELEQQMDAARDEGREHGYETAKDEFRRDPYQWIRAHYGEDDRAAIEKAFLDSLNDEVSTSLVATEAQLALAKQGWLRQLIENPEEFIRTNYSGAERFEVVRTVSLLVDTPDYSELGKARFRAVEAQVKEALVRRLMELVA